MKMNQRNGRSRLTRLISSLLLAALLAVTVSPLQGEAKTVTARYNTYQKAARVGTGSTTIKQAANNAYVRFVAPRTKVYTVTISNIRGYNGSSNIIGLGNFYPRRWKGSGRYKYLSGSRYATNGGHTSSTGCLYTATNYSYNKFYRNKRVTPNLYLAKRYAKIKLRKGQSLYMNYFFTANKGKCCYTLTIR